MRAELTSESRIELMMRHGESQRIRDARLCLGQPNGRNILKHDAIATEKRVHGYGRALRAGSDDAN